MKMKEVPRGTKDFLPQEASLKREIERDTVDIFASWGYREVVTPTLEYLEVIEAGAGTNIRDELFLVQDRDGRLLALRPEMTIPIARVVSTKLKDARFPLRLFYSANIFRHTETQTGRYKEFYQLGVELMGATGVRADAEVISLAGEVLDRQRVEYIISINHIGIFNGLLDQSGLEPSAKEAIKRMVLHKDLVGLEQILTGLPLESSLGHVLLAMPVAHGDLEVLKVLEPVGTWPGVKEAIEELSSVYRLLESYGLAEKIVVDLGVLRGFDYYTGIVFEGYSPRLGYPLLGGGRYDNLLAKFGFPCPATGFALGLERLLLVIKEPRDKKVERFLVSGSEPEAVYREARRLRDMGLIAEVNLNPDEGGEPVTVVPLEDN